MKQHRNKYEYKSWANRERASQGQGPEEGVGGGDLARSDLGRYEDERYCIACKPFALVCFLNVLYLEPTLVIRFVIEAEVKSGASRGPARPPALKAKKHKKYHVSMNVTK